MPAFYLSLLLFIPTIIFAFKVVSFKRSFTVPSRLSESNQDITDLIPENISLPIYKNLCKGINDLYNQISKKDMELLNITKSKEIEVLNVKKSAELEKIKKDTELLNITHSKNMDNIHLRHQLDLMKVDSEFKDRELLRLLNACNARGLLEVVLKGVHCELHLKGLYDAKPICDAFVKCKSSLILNIYTVHV